MPHHLCEGDIYAGAPYVVRELLGLVPERATPRRDDGRRRQLVEPLRVAAGDAGVRPLRLFRVLLEEVLGLHTRRHVFVEKLEAGAVEVAVRDRTIISSRANAAPQRVASTAMLAPALHPETTTGPTRAPNDAAFCSAQRTAARASSCAAGKRCSGASL